MSKNGVRGICFYVQSGVDLSFQVEALLMSWKEKIGGLS